MEILVSHQSLDQGQQKQSKMHLEPHKEQDIKTFLSDVKKITNKHIPVSSTRWLHHWAFISVGFYLLFTDSIAVLNFIRYAFFQYKLIGLVVAQASY